MSWGIAVDTVAIFTGVRVAFWHHCRDGAEARCVGSRGEHLYRGVPGSGFDGEFRGPSGRGWHTLG